MSHDYILTNVVYSHEYPTYLWYFSYQAVKSKVFLIVILGSCSDKYYLMANLDLEHITHDFKSNFKYL
jgi:hypothetical protein